MAPPPLAELPVKEDLVTFKTPPANTAPAMPPVPVPNATLFANVIFVRVVVDVEKTRTAPLVPLDVFDDIVEFCNVTFEPEL